MALDRSKRPGTNPYKQNQYRRGPYDEVDDRHDRGNAALDKEFSFVSLTDWGSGR